MIKRIRFYLSILCIIIVLAGIWGTGTASMSVYAASKGAEEDTAGETEEFRAVWIAYSDLIRKNTATETNLPNTLEKCSTTP